ncbi:MAG: acetate--CoA ligase [Nitrososphaerota archaeon]|nr:acetate--CoA ligase [Nitrososphaerota archaeon]
MRPELLGSSAGTDDEKSIISSQKILPISKYFDLHGESLKDTEKFWSRVATDELSWFKTWDKVLDWQAPFARWFVGGKLNASFNCVDRHISNGNRNKVAYYWEGENGERRVVSYQDLHAEVNKFASALKKLGISSKDKVTIYLPMIPELPVAMLACARLGATFTVVFSGFSSQSLTDRIKDSGSSFVITADGGYRRGRVIHLKEIIDQALESTSSVKKVIVYKRTGESVKMVKDRDVWWSDITSTTGRDLVEPEHVDANHPLYLLYSSGTTGKPKAIVHGTGGYLTYVTATTRWVFDPKPSDVYWCAADIGWVTGHSYIVFGPLSLGLTSILYEGALDYPQNDRLWEMIERYKVNILYTSPTALRGLMKYGDAPPSNHDLSSLNVLGTVGEPINPHVWLWYFNKIGGGRCPIVDTWWQTETGGIMISASPKLGLVPLKPGSATYPLPGVDADVVRDDGTQAKSGEKGYIVVKRPWPGMLLTLHGDDARYRQVYWSKFHGSYYPGDYCVKDEEGYFWLLGRADEVLKVAGHRLGTIEIEDALVSHPAVAESAVTGKHDEIKGESIAAYVIIKTGFVPSKELAGELKEHVRNAIGAIATPSEIHFVKSLPKTRSGKIMRRVIKAVANGMDSVGDITTLEDEASVDEVRKAVDELHAQMKVSKGSL